MNNATRARHRTHWAGLLALAFLLWSGLGCGPSGKNADNTPPDMTLDVGSEETYIVGEDVIQIRVSATDEQGDKLSFAVADKPKRAEFQTFVQQAIFTWDPITSDVTMGEPRKLTFVVTDEHGATSERVVQVTIKPGNGKPRFLNSSSENYDTSSDEPLTFDVEVRDDDSETVDIAMPPDKAPQGATFEQTGDKEGTFTWDPSPSQEEDRSHSVVFVADDMENEPVEQTVRLLLRTQTDDVDPIDPGMNDPTCEETPPLQFEPLPAQRTLEDYPIEAKLTKAAAEKYDFASIL